MFSLSSMKLRFFIVNTPIISALFFSLTLILLLFLCRCADFPVAYDRVDPDMVRCLDFIYEPAEAMPGDTVLVKAVFAGKVVDPATITWSVSWNVVTNPYGLDTAYDVKPLPVKAIKSTFSKNTTTCAFTFVVPSEVLFSSLQIIENCKNFGQLGVFSQLPGAGAPSTTLSAIHQMAMASQAWKTLLQKNPLCEDSLIAADKLYAAFTAHYRPYAALLCQALTTQIRLFCSVTGGLGTILSNYSLRYNRAFTGLPGCRVFINRNPCIDSLGIYKVPGENRLRYDPAENLHQFIKLPIVSEVSVPTGSDSAVIVVEPGYSYFIVTFPATRDSTLTIDAIVSQGPALLEKLSTRWYYNFDADEKKSVQSSQLMTIQNMGNSIEPLFPSQHSSLHRVTLWCELSDTMLNELFRPQGSTLAETKVHFVYK
ncbi:MAG: hypothetical protein JW795_21505 [Chitinivibrionales bacterium]|nr:hypothetical protein [Chitinivibrionales bacterium]